MAVLVNEIDYKNCVKNKYSIFIEQLAHVGVNLEKSDVVLTEKNLDYISTFPINMHSSGIIAELRCPDDEIIVIRGINQSDNPNKVSLRCYNESNTDPLTDTKINIKICSGKHIHPIKSVTYSELSNYYLQEGLYLFSDDRLVFEIIKPDVDISMIKLSIIVDIFKIIHSPVV